jgi:HPt (histidine-containing phosphotransfer) domain-containing protein
MNRNEPAYARADEPAGGIPHDPADGSPGGARTVVRIDRDFAPMIPRFMDNRRKELAAMHEAASRGEYETVRKLAHGIKGAGGSYGFEELTALAAALEQAAKANQGAAVSEGLAAMEQYLGSIDVRYE